MTLPFLFTVEVAFEISGRGCVLAPGVGEDAEVSNVRVGDLIRLVRPNGEITDTSIHGVEMLNYRRGSPPRKLAPISLPRPLTKHDAPPGTLVYYLGSGKII